MSVSGPQAPTHNAQDSRGKGSNVLLASWRKRRRLGIALIVSLFFHLSMITVFKIVIALPREQVSYYDVHLVYSAPAERTDVAQHLPRSEDTLSLTGTALYGELPEVELPVVEFAELERLRIRFDAAQADPGADRMFEAYAPSDSGHDSEVNCSALARHCVSLLFPETEPPIRPQHRSRKRQEYKVIDLQKALRRTSNGTVPLQIGSCSLRRLSKPCGA